MDVFGYHYRQVATLPAMSDDGADRLDTLPALIRFLAEEHATNLLRYAPVTVRFAREIRNRDLVDQAQAIVDQKKRQEAECLKVWEEEKAVRRKQEKEHRDAMRAKHPRWDEWHLVNADELKRLVWSMPTSAVADLFGVSDVAIGKRCKVLGIPKPGRGYWRRVEVGREPRPEGNEPPERKRAVPRGKRGLASTSFLTA